MVAGTLGALARSVHSGTAYSEGYGTATQHARVVMERIAQTLSKAHANEQFPGMIVLAEDVLAWRCPETVVVWRPTGDPVDPDGLPRFNELVVYCPDAEYPNTLVELTAPSDTRTVPPIDDQAAWLSAMALMKSADATVRIELTDLLRTASVSETPDTPRRAALRFEVRRRPSDAQLAAYRGDTLTWEELPWVQGIYGPDTGLRQVWLRTEMQLVPQTRVAADTQGMQPIPFFGSAALYYQMHQ
jgi:hypothetical protein